MEKSQNCKELIYKVRQELCNLEGDINVLNEVLKELDGKAAADEGFSLDEFHFVHRAHKLGESLTYTKLAIGDYIRQLS